jgi:hypothetical protein
MKRFIVEESDYCNYYHVYDLLNKKYVVREANYHVAMHIKNLLNKL